VYTAGLLVSGGLASLATISALWLATEYIFRRKVPKKVERVPTEVDIVLQENKDVLPLSSACPKDKDAVEVEKEEKALQEPETVELEAEDAAAAVPFEISPGDECEFIPLYSEEEDRRIAREMAPPSRLMTLDSENPGGQLTAYLDSLYTQEETSSESEEDHSTGVGSRSLYKDDIGKYVTEKDLCPQDDPRESPSRRGSVMSRVKKARQRVLRHHVEKGMTSEDHLKEQMYTNQMLSRVYTMMRENKETFGEMSFDDIKDQMSMYKA